MADPWFQFLHSLFGATKILGRPQGKNDFGKPCLEPRVENVPVRMPLPPAKDVSSIFKTQQFGGMKSVYED